MEIKRDVNITKEQFLLLRLTQFRRIRNLLQQKACLEVKLLHASELRSFHKGKNVLLHCWATAIWQ